MFSADPRLVPGATTFPAIGYEDMLDLARVGAGVLMPGSVEYARDHKVSIRVRSSFSSEPGTLVTDLPASSGVVGLGTRQMGDNSVITAVGQGAADRLESVSATLASLGIKVLDRGADARGAWVEVAREMTEPTMQAMHDQLIGSEVAG